MNPCFYYPTAFLSAILSNATFQLPLHCLPEYPSNRPFFPLIPFSHFMPVPPGAVSIVSSLVYDHPPEYPFFPVSAQHGPQQILALFFPYGQIGQCKELIPGRYLSSHFFFLKAPLRYLYSMGKGYSYSSSPASRATPKKSNNSVSGSRSVSISSGFSAFPPTGTSRRAFLQSSHPYQNTPAYYF